jgi:hypothetical protein
MRRLGVLGWPVAHSRSPVMHNAALAALGLRDWTYQRLPLPPELFAETVRALPGAGFVGANVTIPHKRAALALADARLAAFEADPVRMARHAVKVMLAFNLLHRRHIALADLPAYLERTPVFMELTAHYLRHSPAALAAWLLDELCRTGAGRVVEGALRARETGAGALSGLGGGSVRPGSLA